MTITKRTSKNIYFLSGIGGSGMNGLAQLLHHQGNTIYGSDRLYDKNPDSEIFSFLLSQGISLFPQNGSGINNMIDALIMSTAIEKSNPDIQEALRWEIPIIKRGKMLADILHQYRAIAIAGTSGKSTVTGMVGHIFCCAGYDPTVINGAIMRNSISHSTIGNTIIGKSPWIIAETDESDETIDDYKPNITLINNISSDHKSMSELITSFQHLVQRTTSFIVLGKGIRSLLGKIPEKSKVITFGLNNSKADVTGRIMTMNAQEAKFMVQDTIFHLFLPGRHNINNALAAIALAQEVGIPLNDIALALSSFQGIKRRMEVIGTVHGITVVDDFAHNPEKIKATLSSYKQYNHRVLVFFQPHGYTSIKFHYREYNLVFSTLLDEEDVLIIPDIYYAGGTVEKTISSSDLIRSASQSGINAKYISDRRHAIEYLVHSAHSGDIILIIGARDHTLTEVAFSVVRGLSSKYA